ncbi:MAG TPA: alpha/beta fold hydrolase [Terracidiphilus sp.]|nr:alpha/beta fold hydrolase [Terracidiphilus sp.]
MPRNKNQVDSASRSPQSAATRTAPPTVSGRWILAALGIVFVAAAFCAWGSLCLLFWQGAWQLLYRPASAVSRTPAAEGLASDPIGFDATDTGTPRLRGWWIPAARGGDANSGGSSYTALYLHDRIGNLGDCVDKLAAIHAAGVNIFAFDYRGYGQSQFVHPSEAHWREDADTALNYLTTIRQIPAGSIVLVGSGLGANLALEVAAAHPDLAGVVLDSPLPTPLAKVFSDPRAHLVPARLLIRDRYDMEQPAKKLRISSLWILAASSQPQGASDRPLVDAYRAVTSPKTLVNETAGTNETSVIARWLSGLHENR